MKSGETQKLTERDTYVFIDVSNIRSACLLTCGFRIDFYKLLDYLRNKYPHLKETRYYEGLAWNDDVKKSELKELQNIGYIVKSLQRRTYKEPAVFKNFRCRSCNTRNRVEVLHQNKRLKSNVDVYLASEMLEKAFYATKPTHIIILSCDGDYTEAIKIAVKNPHVYVTVIATPPAKNFEQNTLSVRLKNLRKEIPDQFSLNSISSFQDNIS